MTQTSFIYQSSPRRVWPVWFGYGPMADNASATRCTKHVEHFTSLVPRRLFEHLYVVLLFCSCYMICQIIYFIVVCLYKTVFCYKFVLWKVLHYIKLYFWISYSTVYTITVLSTVPLPSWPTGAGSAPVFSKHTTTPVWTFCTRDSKHWFNTLDVVIQ